MALDSVATGRVACGITITVVIAACRPVQTGPMPPAEPSSIARVERPRPQNAQGRHVMVGEMCPAGAGGRPAIAPVVMRTVQWTDTPEELGNIVERGATPRFVVFDIEGKRAGIFDTLGLADVGLAQPVAIGAYTGGSACSIDQGGGNRVDDAKCTVALNSCGLAVGELARPDDPLETPQFVPGEACRAGDAIAIDIDGDGVNEAFPIQQVLDGIRAPAQEWSAAPAAAAPCKGSFQLYDIRIDAAGKPDPTASVLLDVLGVLDLDGDGRKEVILAMRFATVRTVVVYSAVGAAQRLELVGESPAFPRP